MKTNKSLAVAALALLAAACGPNPTTLIAGSFSPDSAPENVEIIVGEKVDTLVSVSDGAFEVAVPTDVKSLAYAIADGTRILFVADGSKIELDFSEGEADSDSDKGVNSRVQDFLQWNKDFMEEFRVKMQTASKDEQEDIYDETLEAYNAHMEKTLKANRDNILGVLAVTSMESDDPAQMMPLLKSLDKDLQEDPRVQAMIEHYETMLLTAPGEPFKDFTVQHVSGTDANGEPIYESKSLSDFVGKGKVMLVDFWSPWCPPCKAELPNIKAVWEKFHGDDFDVLSVAVWEESRGMNWRNTIDTAAVYGVCWQQLNNGHQEPAAIYGIQGIPHMILFDGQGNIIKRGDELRGAALEPAVAAALAK